MMYDVPGPGVYGLVQPDGELRLWRNRGRDSTRTWPIWDAAAIPAVRGRPDLGRSPVFKLPAHSAEIDRDRTWVRERGWHPVLFGYVPKPAPFWYDAFASLHARIDVRVWWTSNRKTARDRRALYMPAMPRDELVLLARNLEARADAGAKTINRQPIGVWIRRAWDVIERRERGDSMGVSP